MPSIEINSNNKHMATIIVEGKLVFVKAIFDVTHVSLYEAKQIADEIAPQTNVEVTFDPKKFGWTIETLKEIVTRANSIHNSVKVLSYE